MTWTRHPLSALFSRCDLKGEDLQNLADDIKANGQLLPITIHEGMILDGWNRFQACTLAQVEPFTMPLAPGVDPWEFVKGSNMFRRHMSPAERVEVMLLHMKMGGVPNGTPSVREIQKDLEVGQGTAQRAQKVLKAQDPVLTEALINREVSLDHAADLAKLPEAERHEALAHPHPEPKVKKPEAEGCAGCRDLQERLDELASEVAAGNDEYQSMLRIIEADDRLAQAHAEVKRFTELNRVLQERLNGKMTECHSLAQDAKRWMRKAERLEKQIKALDKDETFAKAVNS